MNARAEFADDGHLRALGQVLAESLATLAPDRAVDPSRDFLALNLGLAGDAEGANLLLPRLAQCRVFAEVARYGGKDHCATVLGSFSGETSPAAGSCVGFGCCPIVLRIIMRNGLRRGSLISTSMSFAISGLP